jgi:hypothetical protein
MKVLSILLVTGLSAFAQVRQQPVFFPAKSGIEPGMQTRLEKALDATVIDVFSFSNAPIGEALSGVFGHLSEVGSGRSTSLSTGIETNLMVLPPTCVIRDDPDTESGIIPDTETGMWPDSESGMIPDSFGA